MRRPNLRARQPGDLGTSLEEASSPCGKRSMLRPRWSGKPPAEPVKAWPITESLVDFINQQTRHNFEHFQALSQPTNWSHAARLQSQFLQASWMRTARFTRRYWEVSQAAMTSALSTARGQARKSA